MSKTKQKITPGIYRISELADKLDISTTSIHRAIEKCELETTEVVHKNKVVKAISLSKDNLKKLSEYGELVKQNKAIKNGQAPKVEEEPVKKVKEVKETKKATPAKKEETSKPAVVEKVEKIIPVSQEAIAKISNLNQKNSILENENRRLTIQISALTDEKNKLSEHLSHQLESKNRMIQSLQETIKAQDAHIRHLQEVVESIQASEQDQNGDNRNYEPKGKSGSIWNKLTNMFVTK
jgi:hypothetical protein